MPPRPMVRKRSDRAPVGAPPVHSRTAPNSTIIIPRVAMNDGTLSSVVISPLTRPMRRPKPIMTARTARVRPSSPSSSLAAMTTWAPTSEPTDRSNSPATITRYWPAARTSSGAAFFTNAISVGASTKSWSRYQIQPRITPSRM